MKKLLLKNDVLVHCQVILVLVFRWYYTTAQECVDGEVRDQLEYRSASDDYGGDVYYCLNGTWATVCKEGSSWATDEATVACRQLGYSDTGAGAGSEVSCAGTNSFVSINCDSGEESLRNCDVKEITASGGIARVACRPGCVTNGEVRLAGGSSDREGRVEVCMDRRWGTVCNNSQEGRVGAVCYQLGFSRINATRSTTVSVRVGPVYQCTVNDSAIECTITSSSQCDHSNDLTFSCLTHEYVTDYLLSQLNKTNSIVTECTQELNETNSSLQQCTEQSIPQTSTSVPQALLAVTVVFLAGVIVGWIVTCVITKNYLCHLCRKRHKSGNSSNNDFPVSKQPDARDAHANSPIHANLPDPHQEIPSNYPEMGALEDAYATVDLKLKKKGRQEKQRKQVSGSSHQREGESSYYPETEPSEGPSLPVKPPKYTGPGALPSNEGGGQGDVEFYTQDDNRVYAAVVKPKKNRKKNKY